jgi:hypothetical protein
MGISRQEWELGIQNNLAASSQLEHGEPRMRSAPRRGLIRRRLATALVAATAAASVLAIPAGAASARPLPGDGVSKSCRVDVRSSSVGFGAKHLFVIYYERGKEQYFRGGPSKGGGSSGSSSSSSDSSSGSSSGSSGSSYGPIVTKYGDYRPGTIDYDRKAPSVTALSGAKACGKNHCFAKQARRINKLDRNYRPLGPNSNSVARTFLAKCKVRAKKPGGWAPGFDKVL